MTWKPNNGSLPELARGKRVKVRLANGMTCGETAIASGVPKGWPADSSITKGPPVRWSKSGHPFDVAEWDFV